MVKEGGNTLDIHGLENLSAGALIMDAASYAEAADSSVTLGAENISLESIANTKGNARNGKPVDQLPRPIWRIGCLCSFGRRSRNDGQCGFSFS